MAELHVGMSSKSDYVATAERLADRYGNTGVPVLATPHLVSLAESECVRCVTGALDPGWSTVGIRVDVRHLAATPLGMRFTMRAELIEMDRRRLVFSVAAHDEVEKVFEGIHERFLVETEPFLAKVSQKGTQAKR